MERIRYDFPPRVTIKGFELNRELENAHANFDELLRKVGSKLFVGLISQTSTDAPTANILSNNCGEIVLARESAGVYTLTPPANTLILNKTIPVVEHPVYDIAGNKITLELVGTTHFLISTFDSAGDPADGILNNQFVSFQVF